MSCWERDRWHHRHFGTYSRVELSAADTVENPDISSQAHTERRRDEENLQETGPRLDHKWAECVGVFVADLGSGVAEEEEHGGAHELSKHGDEVAARGFVHLAKEFGGRPVGLWFDSFHRRRFVVDERDSIGFWAPSPLPVGLLWVGHDVIWWVGSLPGGYFARRT